MQHVDVLICTPGRNMLADYVSSLVDTIKKLEELGISYKFLNGRSSVVHLARELTLNPQEIMNQKVFGGELTYNKIFWIDSDMCWTPDDFLKLYESPHDIISGCYLTANSRTVAAFHRFRKPMMLMKEMIPALGKKPVEISSTGFGFLAIKSGVFESMQQPWFRMVNILTEDSEGNEKVWHCVSEDIAWCYLAQKAGFKMYLDPLVRVGHVKTIPVKFD